MLLWVLWVRSLLPLMFQVLTNCIFSHNVFKLKIVNSWPVHKSNTDKVSAFMLDTAESTQMLFLADTKSSLGKLPKKSSSMLSIRLLSTCNRLSWGKKLNDSVERCRSWLSFKRIVITFTRNWKVPGESSLTEFKDKSNMDTFWSSSSIKKSKFVIKLLLKSMVCKFVKL